MNEQDTIQAFENIANIIRGTAKKEEVEEVLLAFKSMLENTSLELSEKIEEVEELINLLESKTSENSQTVTKELLNRISVLKVELERKIKEIELTPGEPGKDASPQDVANILKNDPSFIEKTQGKEGTPGEIKNIKPEEIRDSLQSLKGDERLDKSAIKGLEEDLKKIGSARSGGSTVGPISRRTKIRAYSLTSQCDGVTKTFTVPKKTVDVLGVFGTQFPVQFDPSEDYTFFGNTITLGSSVGAPQTDQTLWALLETI